MNEASDRSDPFVVLGLDRAEAEMGALRLVGAAVTLVAAATLVALRPSVVGWGCALAGVAFSLMWVGRWARARRMTSNAETHFLALAPAGLELSAGAARTQVGWDAVEAVRVDEERLVLEIARQDGEPLSVDPRYGGLGLYDLEEAVRSAWRAARTDQSCP